MIDDTCERRPAIATHEQQMIDDGTRTRVLHIAWLKAQYGGAHRYLDRLAQRLLERGHRVLLAVNRQEVERPFLERLCDMGAMVFYLPLEESAKESAAILDKLVSQYEPGLIHFNSGARQPRALAKSMTCWRSRQFQRVLTMHAPLFHTRMKVGERLLANVPLSTARSHYQQRLEFARRFHRIISVSKQFADLNAAVLKLDSGVIIHIPNGVDTSRFRPRCSSEAVTAGPIVIGGCGTLVKIKGFDLLVEAAARLQAQTFEIRIAGEGPERRSLQMMIDHHKLTERIQLVGHQTDVAGFLRELDVFVMPSAQEAFPYAQLEAMATGLPSVVSDVGDLPLMARHGREALVFPPGDVAALSESLQSLIEDVPMRRAMGLAARQRVVEHYEQTHCENRTLAEFNSLLLG